MASLRDGDSMFFLISGLGNPGEAYQGHRHNVGFWAVERLAQAAGLGWEQGPGSWLRAKGSIQDLPVLLVKPLTYMNLSGQAVVQARAELGVEAERILILHDDLDLDLGRLQVRQGGGDGGHRGIRSVTAELGSAEFARIRMGVGRPSSLSTTVDHVLSGFDEEELVKAEAMADRAAQAAQVWMREGLKAAMNRFNPWKKPEPKNEEASTDAGQKSGDAIP